ncbi:MAG TPA: NUDIX hydrolase [Pyrinomonadaceae bacterium]|jgi:8-oxo-dGTP pyrophosphatase MutT (NUDIX family)|nr:NUDIX hydrolase [Pyrinomonadaceae bacterium]
MDGERIRPIVICLFSHGGRILVSQSHDPAKQDYFCRPLGGGIEFGERSRDAVRREVREEIGVEIENLELIGVLENLFTYVGRRWHEIVFVYDAEFVDKSLYGRDEIVYHELELAGDFVARWRSLAEIEADNVRLVPEGLTGLLKVSTTAG